MQSRGVLLHVEVCYAVITKGHLRVEGSPQKKKTEMRATYYNRAQEAQQYTEEGMV